MVDLVLLQTVSYIAGALGVCVAAVYYAVTLKEQSRNRKIALTNSVVQQIGSEAGVREVITQFQMNWKDLQDFREKYDSSTNLDNSTLRHHYWLQMDTLGYLLKNGFVDREIIYISGGWMAMMLWVRFKPLIEEFRRTEMGLDAYTYFEYLAGEMYRMKLGRDPDYPSHTGRSREEWEEAFA
ncbi:MAG: hypothetical protein ABSA11_17475 [Candidatus Bathyarchaeia archaeon]|jgi:hypothetical protein